MHNSRNSRIERHSFILCFSYRLGLGRHWTTCIAKQICSVLATYMIFTKKNYYLNRSLGCSNFSFGLMCNWPKPPDLNFQRHKLPFCTATLLKIPIFKLELISGSSAAPTFSETTVDSTLIATMQVDTRSQATVDDSQVLHDFWLLFSVQNPTPFMLIAQFSSS